MVMGQVSLCFRSSTSMEWFSATEYVDGAARSVRVWSMYYSLISDLIVRQRDINAIPKKTISQQSFLCRRDLCTLL